MSDLKGSKNESKTKNFNMGFQKKSNYESSLFFAKYVAHKFQQYNRISNVISMSKQNQQAIEVGNHSTVKGKRKMFSKDNSQSI